MCPRALASGFFPDHSLFYNTEKQTQNEEKELVFASLSSKRENKEMKVEEIILEGFWMARSNYMRKGHERI